MNKETDTKPNKGDVEQLKNPDLKDTLQPASIADFYNPRDFNFALKNEEDALVKQAEADMINGIKTKDQDLPIKEFYLLLEKDSIKPAIVVIGGMGSLAGVQSTKMVAEKYGDDRNILLYQLTATPDRTQAIKDDIAVGKISDTHEKVVDTLQSGIEIAVESAQKLFGNKNFEVIVICNTAHRFLPEVKLPENIRLISLIDSTVDRLTEENKRMGNIKLSALYTDGTRASKVYSGKFDQAGIDYIEPNEQDQDSLMRAIYNGVKAFNKIIAIEDGENALAFLKNDDSITHVLAGCTEIPEIIRWIKEGSNDSELVQRLNEVVIIDPGEEAISRIANDSQISGQQNRIANLIQKNL